MRRKNKKAVFICSITGNYLKVVRCLVHNSKREFVSLEQEALPVNADDKKIAERLSASLKKLKYDNNPLIISLPRNQATCRQIKLPTQLPEEIKGIVSLQASRYLPYPANELITGYQIISTDKDGYSSANLVIVHKDVIERYVKLLRELKIKRFIIALNSYGICNLYTYIKKNEPGSAMVIDIDSESAELVIVFDKKAIFSRYFKLDRLRPDFENLFIEEINKTQNLYLKERLAGAPQKIIILGTGKRLLELTASLNNQVSLPVEILPYTEEINLSESLSDSIINSPTSFTSLIGLGINNIEESLYLLPQELKDEAQGKYRRKEAWRLNLLILGIILAWVLGVAKNLDNKANYLRQIKSELSKISPEAISLEEIEKRARLLESRLKKKVSSLDVLYEIHKIMPSEISLVNFNYEESSQITLRGEAQELNPVFTFVSQLGGSPVFNNFNVKVRYATNKKIQSGEIVDFEIVCSKK